MIIIIIMLQQANTYWRGDAAATPGVQTDRVSTRRAEKRCSDVSYLEYRKNQNNE